MAERDRWNYGQGPSGSREDDWQEMRPRQAGRGAGPFGRNEPEFDRDRGAGRFGGERGYGREEPRRFGGPSDYQENRQGRDLVGEGHAMERAFGRGFGRDVPREGYDDRGGGYGRGPSGREEERGFFERAGDEVASWFGGEDASRRRTRDAREGDAGAQHHRGRGPRNYQRSDERIREDLNDRLTDDPHVDASDIEVAVQGREVTLSGTVGSRFEKRHAEDIADGVSGVAHVQNNLRVRSASSVPTEDAPPGPGERTTGGLLP